MDILEYMELPPKSKMILVASYALALAEREGWINRIEGKPDGRGPLGISDEGIEFAQFALSNRDLPKYEDLLSISEYFVEEKVYEGDPIHWALIMDSALRKKH